MRLERRCVPPSAPGSHKVFPTRACILSNASKPTTRPKPERKVDVKRTALERGVAGLLTNFLASWSHSEIAVDDNGDWAPHLLVGGRPDEWQELYREISPIVHLGPNTPPTLQFVGEHDVYVSRSGSELALHRRLREAGVPSVYVEFPRTDHAFDMFLPELSPAAQAAMYDVDRFLALMASPFDWVTSHFPPPQALAM